MRKIRIPGSNLEVSCLCLGTYPFGFILNEQDSFKLMDAFLDAGGNFLDTAYVYGTWVEGAGCSSESEVGIRCFCSYWI